MPYNEFNSRSNRKTSFLFLTLHKYYYMQIIWKREMLHY